MRVTEGARGGVEAWKKRARELEDTVAWADAVFGAHPGVVLIWEDTLADSETDWGKPRIYGSPLALASLLRFSGAAQDRKSTRLNSSHSQNSYAVFCLKKKI